MKYQIRQGQEHKFAITDNINDEDEFLYPAFNQALYALKKIVANAKTFKRDSDIEFYGYSQNIIAFSGVRGMGKTSAMVSFSRAMKSNTLSDEFKLCRFEVLPPVDPTIMEQHQNIVKLILSRMYRLAENTWRKAERTHYHNVTDAKKNDLLTLFNECLSSLDAIKNTDTSSASNLSAISRISDSSILKQKLYDLVAELLTFSKQNDSGNDFLVIQLDDTDTSTSNCYEILEDLRKFLSVPNVIILMATDIKLLRTVILQHYIDEFSSCRKEEVLSISHLEKMESKYIDKIIPPTHAIHLPKLDECVVNYADKLKLSYADPSGANNLLFTNQDDNNPEEHLSAQELILRYVYRKTGIVFASSMSNYHSIIPTTLRGLSQFLAVLSSMEDIPQVTNFEDPKKFRESLGEYIKVAEDNINRFEKYFLNEWAEAKLSQKQAAIISDIANTNPDSRLIYIADCVTTLYKSAVTKGENMTRKKHDVKNYESFVDFIDECENDHRSGSDVYFFFAIKTYLTIMHHKTALSVMRKAVEHDDDKKLLLFDFSPDKTMLPDTFAIPNARGGRINNRIIYYHMENSEQTPDEEKIEKAILNNLYRNHYTDDITRVNCFAFTNLIPLALSLGDANIRMALNFDDDDQKNLFDVQIAALTISSNFDLHKNIHNAAQNCKVKIYQTDLLERLNEFYQHLDSEINAANNNKGIAPTMLSYKLSELQKLVTDRRYGQIVELFGNITRRIENSKSNTLKEMAELYKQAKEIHSSLQDDSIESEKITKLQLHIAQLISKINELYSAYIIDQALIDEKLASRLRIHAYARKNFLHDFTEKLKLLCKECGVGFDDLKTQSEVSE